MIKLSKRSIDIKTLIRDETYMGTYGLVELELIEFDKEIERLKEENKALRDELTPLYYQSQFDNFVDIDYIDRERIKKLLNI